VAKTNFAEVALNTPAYRQYKTQKRRLTSESGFIGFPTAWVIPFLCFLPMCFYFVATVTSHLQQEVRELQEQVAKLQEKQL
jgi:hypothetical protein